MGDVLFTFDSDVAPDAVRRALTTTEGITSFWTDKADIPEEVGETLKLGFRKHRCRSTCFLPSLTTR